MKRFLLCLFFSISVLQVQASPNLPDFSGFTRRYLVSLSPSDISFIFSENKDGAQPNYNWSLPYGYTPICTLSEVEKIRDALGRENFAKYGDIINYGWLYDQRDFEASLRKFQALLKKDKSDDARIILHVVEKDLDPKNIEQQKRLIENEIARNEVRLSERGNMSRTKAANLAKNLSRRFKSCLGRYQTGYISLTTQINNR